MRANGWRGLLVAMLVLFGLALLGLSTVSPSAQSARYGYDPAGVSYDRAGTSAPASAGMRASGSLSHVAQQRANGVSHATSSATARFVAAEAGGAASGGAARSTNFVVHRNGDVVPIPSGAAGPRPVDTGKGFQFTGGSGGHGLDPRVTDVRIMDPVTGGKYPYPNGYVSHSNSSGQAVNPYKGETVGKSDPWWHWPFS